MHLLKLMSVVMNSEVWDLVYACVAQEIICTISSLGMFLNICGS